MTIKPKDGILLIKKHKNTQLSADIVVEESDEDKRLITGEIIEGTKQYPSGISIIFGKYALFLLTLQNVDYHFLQEGDVIGITDYQEK